MLRAATRKPKQVAATNAAAEGEQRMDENEKA